MEGNIIIRDHSAPTRQVDQLSNVTFGAPTQSSPALVPGVPPSCILSQFNQLVAKHKWKAEFELTSCEGAAHNPVFNYVLKVNNAAYHGTGSTKKMAKNEAAKAYFNDMGGEKKQPEDKNNSPTCIQSQFSSSTTNSSPPPNPIEKTPSYTFSLDSDSMNYTDICMVGDIRASGEQPSQKDAKQLSSMNMLLEINKKNKEPQVLKSSSNAFKTPNIVPQWDGIKTLVPLESVHKRKIASFHKELTKSDDLITFLKDTNIVDMGHLNFHKLLMDLSKAHGFHVEFSHNNVEEQKLAIAQLGVFPVIVTIGIGQSMEEATSNASKNVLIYLKALFK